MCDRVLLMAGLQLCNLLGRGTRHSVTSQCRGGGVPYDYMLLIVSLFLDFAGLLRGASRVPASRGARVQLGESSSEVEEVEQ